MDLNSYPLDGLYDELLTPRLTARAGSGRLINYLKKLKPAELRERKDAAELAIMAMGITFTVYGKGTDSNREWPYDIIPRIIPRREWQKIEAGLKQRLMALNHFINDIYNRRQIIKDRVIPAELLKSSLNYRKECQGMAPVFGVWAHICGSDLVRGHDGTIYALEDNLRVPSGVSYMLENRNVTKRVFPELFKDYNIIPMGDYPSNLLDIMSSISPRPLEYPEVVVLTPGIHNSAYFEHAFLAQQMGAELVEGSDLMVADDDCVYMKTVEGPARVDVIYRRIDDLFLDPEVFNKKSVLGVPGLMRAWKKGRVALANAPGSGVADDKVIYTYVPAMIKYYLDQAPIIPNVPSYCCADKKQRDHVLANLAQLVVKPANESGGYGILIGPNASKRQLNEMKNRLRSDPRNYIAQPVIALSTVPTVCDGRIEPRHVDLRPFTLQADRGTVTAGGLTRVAMAAGSLVVNSSQGGGSKDTWVVGPD